MDQTRANDELPQVTLVAALVAPATQSLADELRRDALHVAVCSADVLRAPPQPMVYVFSFDAALAIALADRVVAWANQLDVRAGLVGLVADGGGGEREALLAAGFDDVLAGALSARELAGRVRAVHRRMQWSAGRGARLRFGGLALDLHAHAAWLDGRSIALTPIELAVLRELVRAAGRPLPRARLLEAAWGGDDLDVTERAVDNVILRLRRKLPRPDAIETVRGVGFRLDV